MNYSLTDYDRVSDKLRMIDRSGDFHILIINDDNLTQRIAMIEYMINCEKRKNMHIRIAINV